MKELTSFRLKHNVLNILEVLAKDMDRTKTSIVEKAVLDFYKRTTEQASKVAKYSGILQEDEAEALISDIYSSRVNKQVKFGEED